MGPCTALGPWQEVASALRAAKHDVSKPVREAAAAALPIVHGFLDFLASGGCAEQWPAACGRLLAQGTDRQERGRTSGKPAVPRKAACQETQPNSPPMAAHCGSIPPGGGIFDAGGALDAASPCCSQMPGACSSASPPPVAQALTLHMQQGGASPPAAASPASTVVQPEQPLAIEQLAGQLAAIQDRQASLACALVAFSSSTEETMRQLRTRLDCIDAGVHALLRGGSGTGAQADAAPQPPRQADCSQELPACCQRKRLSLLHRSFEALEQQLHPAKSPLPPFPTQQAADAVFHEASIIHSGAGPQQAPLLRRCDWNAAYARLLGGGDSCGTAQQLRLLRAMVRSGPVWEQLERSTAHLLLAAIASLLRAGVALKRLLPWLWPLADAASASGAAARRYLPELRSNLLAALEACELPTTAAAEAGKGPEGGARSMEHLPLGEQRDLLLSRLRTNWS